MRESKGFVNGMAKSVLLVIGLSIAGTFGRTFAVSAQESTVLKKFAVVAAVPPERSLPIPPPQATLSADSIVLQRISEAHAGSRLAQMDFLGEGTVTVQTEQGPVSIGVRVLRNGLRGQHIELKQADGKFANMGTGALTPAVRRILDVLQTQHDRGVRNLLQADARTASMRDGGIKDGSQAIVRLEPDGKATRYIVDGMSERIVRLEFQRGWSSDASGRSLPNLESYVFSDVRIVSGLPTPFKVEHYINGTKQDEVVFFSVRYIPGNRDTNPNPVRGGN